MIEIKHLPGPPTPEEAITMAKEEWRDIKRKYGWFSFLWRGLEAFQEAAGSLRAVMPRGKERLLR